jgi:hypothetical protein
MPPQRKANDVDSEAQLQAAVEAASSRKIASMRAAAKAFKVPYATLRARLNGRQPRNKAHEYDQILTHLEENELKRWITRMTRVGYPTSYSQVREMAEEIRKLRVAQINETDIQHVVYDTIGKHWVRQYLNGKISDLSLKFFEFADFLKSSKLFLDFYEKCLQPQFKHLLSSLLC